MNTQGKCGRNCLECTLVNTFCPGCITHVCLISECKRGISHIGITDPKSFCRLREYCTSPNVIPADYMIQAMPKLKVQTKVKFPRFVPVISLTDKRSWFWDDLLLP